MASTSRPVCLRLAPCFRQGAGVVFDSVSYCIWLATVCTHATVSVHVSVCGAGCFNVWTGFLRGPSAGALGWRPAAVLDTTSLAGPLL